MIFKSAYKNAGFTLIELIFMIAIIGILTFSMMTQWPGSNLQIAYQARQLASDIQFTQTLSMTKGQRYYLIKTSTSSYQIQDSAGTAIKLPLGNTTVTLQSGISFGTFSNLPNNLVSFDGAGKPYTTSTSPGTALSSTAVITLTSGSTTLNVSILPTTGNIYLS